MTERERDMELLDALLQSSGEASGAAAAHDELLTRGEEQKLLQEANDTPPPTLAPTGEMNLKRASAPASFGAEVIEIVRRHPIAAVLLSISVAIVLGRRNLSRR
jgi:hypothetical protein